MPLRIINRILDLSCGTQRRKVAASILILVMLFIVFIGIQFIPIYHAKLPVPKALMVVHNSNDAVATYAFSRSCIDCHNGHTAQPWYGKVAPLSWVTVGHQNMGRTKLDFSE